MLDIQTIRDTFSALDKGVEGYPWKNVMGGYPAYIPDYGYIQVLKIEKDPQFGDVSEWTIAFKFKGVDQTFEADVSLDSWDGPEAYSARIFEVEEYEETVKKYRRK